MENDAAYKAGEDFGYIAGQIIGVAIIIIILVTVIYLVTRKKSK